ncbi:two-component sensor histidine kinase [Pseudoclavibacter sp. RFBJ3]|nr:two-component sensor histidine kinase [Pseudoclavibacter sp. RFBJ5]PPF94844.1 two-component sensor histidine kinase [Pseudoclavibacter sp. RFBH5]PPF95356.1 two-component sensor histidine kinase [Pseudoclavibacter sp. RFBJ3]PPG19484.1 two-component sensor histidine kinase [Pseudoclavibacter sp. RFBI4]
MSEAPPTLGHMITSARGSELWQRLQGIDAEHPADWKRPGPSPRALRTDIVVALVAVALMVFSNWAVLELRKGADPAEVGAILHDTDPASALVGMVLVPAMYGVAIALRRRFPLWMLVLCTVAFVSAFAFTYLDTIVTQIGYFLVLFTAGAWSNQRALVTLLRIGITIGMIVWALVDSLTRATLVFTFSDGSDSENWITSVFGAYTLLINVLYFIGAFWFGNSDFRRAGQRAALEERTRELEEYTAALADERRLVEEQAIRLDRVRIARELHDVVAHHVSLMGLQAAAARRTAETSPEKSQQALLGVEQSARVAIDELHSLLTTLRSADADADSESADGGQRENDGASGAQTGASAPSTHTIEQVPALIEELRGAGMRVEFSTLGEPRPVSPLTGIAVYRVLQESLTNTRKHAGPDAPADVRLRYLERGVELDVTDDGPASLAHAAASKQANGSGGLGLVGMRERARAAGGDLTTSKRGGGGFRVLLRVPYERQS